MDDRKYPLFTALGSRHAFLGNEAATAATRDERIRSVWPFLVRQVKLFHQSLKPRERAHFDPEDALSELWVALAERDHKWSPEKGKYITFAGVVVQRKLTEIRERAHTVSAPRNTTCRLKEYAAEEEGGTISPERQKTANDIRRTVDGTSSISAADGDVVLGETETQGPPEILDGYDRAATCRAAIAGAVRTLTTYEAVVVGRIAGLRGHDCQTTFRIGWETGRDESEVRIAKNSAFAKIRAHLYAVGHPATEFDS